MKQSPKVGACAELTNIVSPEHVIDFASDEMPAVLSTPWLIWFLEHAAREAMIPLLELGESTVGVRVDVEHLAPTPLGRSFTCTARIIHVEGTLISFSVEAFDETERIARGTHKLQVIEKSRFRKRVQRKQMP